MAKVSLTFPTMSIRALEVHGEVFLSRSDVVNWLTKVAEAADESGCIEDIGLMVRRIRTIIDDGRAAT